jgi:hypothetical protein
VLCGAFVQSLLSGKPPESQDGLRKFFVSLGEMESLYRQRLFWVLGIDLAHIGRRYGDALDAAAESGYLLEVREQDHERLNDVCSRNSAAFLDKVLPERDPLKWCGFTPLYTFMQAVPNAHGKLLKYDQWNIDDHSVVSFAAMEFANR